jgi:hypothetical protein
MSTSDNNELKERERCAWASVADGWKRRDELLRTDYTGKKIDSYVIA